MREFEKESTRSPSVDISPCKRLCACRKREQGITESHSSNILTFVISLNTQKHTLFILVILFRTEHVKILVFQDGTF